MTATDGPDVSGPGWHRVASSLVRGEVYGIDELDVVLWRSGSGVPCAMAGRCPHQWFPLENSGSVEGEELVCRVHGWRFRADGTGWKRNEAGRLDIKGPIEVRELVERPDGIWVRSSATP